MKLCIKKCSSDIKRPDLTASEMGDKRADCFPSPRFGFAAYLDSELCCSHWSCLDPCYLCLVCVGSSCCVSGCCFCCQSGLSEYFSATLHSSPSARLSSNSHSLPEKQGAVCKTLRSSSEILASHSLPGSALHNYNLH